MKLPRPLITTRELASRLGINQMRLCRLISRGLVRPDFQCHDAMLFFERRVRQIERLLAKT